MNSLLSALPLTDSSSSPASENSLRKSWSVSVLSARRPVSTVNWSVSSHLNLA
jgi:hypothetical protein